MSRATRKRKVAQLEEESSLEESRPTKKQKVTKKTSNNSKDKAKNNQTKKTKNDAEDNSNDEADEEIIPVKLTKEELKAIALQKLIANNAINMQREVREDEEQFLPDELLLQIFSYFNRRELASIAPTCRQWNRLSHDQSLGWHFIASVFLYENCYAYFAEHHLDYHDEVSDPVDEKTYDAMWHDKRHEVAKQYRAVFMKRCRGGSPVIVDVLDNQLRNNTLILLTEQREVLFYATQNVHHYWEEMNKDPNLWSYRIRKVSFEELQQLRKIRQDVYTTNSDEDLSQWLVDVEINITRLEHLAATNQTIAALSTIRNALESELSKTIEAVSSTKETSIPRRSFTAQQQPEGFKDDIKLYKYQLDAIAWMKSVEQNTEGIPYFKAYTLPGTSFMITHDLKVYSKSSTDLDEVFDVIVPRGAILADEMGLGKTMEVIGLMLSVPPPKRLPEHEKLFATRATLVLCPNHLVKQWTDEIEKVTDLKVAVIATMVQLKKYTYEDLLDYDVVIASYQLLTNLNYRDHRLKWKEYKSKSFASLRKKVPVLEQFYWHRLVLDEGHEHITDENYSRHFRALFTRFAWYVTGTPFPSHNHVEPVKHFLGIPPAPQYPLYWQDNITMDLVLRELYWRHTKASVQGEYKIPDYVEDLAMVEFDEIERALYSDIGYDHARAEMCGQLLHESTLDERLEHLLDETKNLVEFYTKQIEEGHKVPADRQQHYARCPQKLEEAKKVLKLASNATPFAKRDKKLMSTEIAKLTLQHGSKMAHMISYLKKLFVRKPDSRVIFFSQYDDKLSGVSQVLTDHNIANVFVEGNVWKRTKALTNFKKDEDVKVIMLSLKNAASGTNLVEATHVILMDPVTGSKKEAQAIESQAIGRAFRQGQTKQITIVRFVVRNTIEHALYLRNNDVNEDTTVVMTKDNKPQLVRSSSAAMLKRSSSVGLVEMKNNTNVDDGDNMNDD